MLEHFVPKDCENSDKEYHRTIRQQTTEPIDTQDDIPFIYEEIIAILAKFDPNKAPGEDGINNEILIKTAKCFPKFFTQIYNECLRRGHFPKQ